MPTTLRTNEIFSTLDNMIISQVVMADNFSHDFKLVDEARTDGGLYGDTKRYIAVDVLGIDTWGGDTEAANLLNLDRPADPDVQDIHLDKFKQIRLTVDHYLTKRAFMEEGSFMQFTNVMIGMLSETKQVFDNTTYNTFIGIDRCDAVAAPAQNVTIDITTAVGSATGMEAARLRGTAIAEGIANLIDLLADYSREYTDFGNLRSYSESSLKFIWNTEWVNRILKVDLPTIFHDEELKKHVFDRKLPARYFGTVQTSAATADGTTHRYIDAPDSTNNGSKYFAGDLVPSGTSLLANTYYVADPDVICKIYVKLPPYMSAFTVGTSFFNPRSLTENHYLTFGYNTLVHLKNYPCITVTAI